MPSEHKQELLNVIGRWNNGDDIEIVWMGFGRDAIGYEQCIWTYAWQMVASHMDDADMPPLGEDDDDAHSYWAAFGDGVCGLLDRDGLITCGLTGAQFGAAKNIAAVMLYHGHTAGLAKAPAERHATLSRGDFPLIELPA